MPPELAELAREARLAIRKQDLRLAQPLRVQEDLAGLRGARLVLRRDAKLEIAHRDPRGLAAPARLHEALLERERLQERGAGEWGTIELEPSDEPQVAHDDRERPRFTHSANMNSAMPRTPMRLTRA